MTFTFKPPNVPFAGVVSPVPIVPQHIWASVTDPVKFANTQPGRHRAVHAGQVRADPVHAEEEPELLAGRQDRAEQVLFPAQSSNQSTNQLDVTSGKFDWSYNFLPNVKQTYVAQGPEAQHLLVPAGRHDRAVPQPDQGAVQRRQLPQGRLARPEPAPTIATKAVNGYLDQASQSGLILPNLQKWLDPSLPNQG